MVPLAEAWRSGADTWTADQRRDFGNDLKDPRLLIASESSNSSKSDSGPAEWKQTNKTFSCTNGKDYTHIKSVWKLTTTDEEKTALSSMLDTCSVWRSELSGSGVLPCRGRQAPGRRRLVACWPRLRILLCAEGALTVTVVTPTGLACVQGWAPPGRRSPLHGMCEGLFRAQARWAHHAQ
jgi:hypothetical protein